MFRLIKTLITMELSGSRTSLSVPLYLAQAVASFSFFFFFSLSTSPKIDHFHSDLLWQPTIASDIYSSDYRTFVGVCLQLKDLLGKISQSLRRQTPFLHPKSSMVLASTWARSRPGRQLSEESALRGGEVEMWVERLVVSVSVVFFNYCISISIHPNR